MLPIEILWVMLDILRSTVRLLHVTRPSKALLWAQ